MLITGCQKPENPSTPTLPKQPQSKEKITDLNKICKNLSIKMQSIDAERTIFALEDVNRELKICLPLMSYSEQMKLFELSHQMYDAFFSIERSEQQEKLFQVFASATLSHPSLQQHNFEHLHIRDQYLITHKNQAYVEIFDNGERFVYRRNPHYMSKIFAPYLPEAEGTFVQQLAYEQQQNLILDQHLALEVAEIAARARFWETYLHDYPTSRYYTKALNLSQFYQFLLFFGLDQQPTSYLYQGRSSIEMENLAVIEALATEQNSLLSHQAQRFLNFLDQETTSSDLNNQKQLQHLLKLPEHVFSKVQSCFSDLLCH